MPTLVGIIVAVVVFIVLYNAKVGNVGIIAGLSGAFVRYFISKMIQKSEESKMDQQKVPEGKEMAQQQAPEVEGEIEEKKKAGLIQCPTCNNWDVVRGAYIENGDTGEWCPNCKKSLQKMMGKI